MDYDVIKNGFNFFNIKVEVGNTIEFLNEDNVAICKMPISIFEDNNIKRELKMSNNGKIISYFKKNNTYFFRLQNSNEIDYMIKIIKNENKYTEIDFLTSDLKEKYPLRKIKFTETGFDIGVSNQINPYLKNYSVEKKVITADSPKEGYNPTLTIISKESSKDEKIMIATPYGVTINGFKEVGNLYEWQYNLLINNIILHKSNKDFLIDVFDKVNEQISGCKKFLERNFEIYNNIINTPYKIEPVAEVLISKMEEEKALIR